MRLYRMPDRGQNIHATRYQASVIRDQVSTRNDSQIAERG